MICSPQESLDQQNKTKNDQMAIDHLKGEISRIKKIEPIYESVKVSDDPFHGSHSATFCELFFPPFHENQSGFLALLVSYHLSYLFSLILPTFIVFVCLCNFVHFIVYNFHSLSSGEYVHVWKVADQLCKHFHALDSSLWLSLWCFRMNLKTWGARRN